MRRALTDVSAQGSAKAELARAVFGGKVDDIASQLVATAAEQRWTATHDLPDALERLGVESLVRSAEDPGRIADELFAVSRVLDEQPVLRRVLSDPAGKPADRAALARRLFEGKVSDDALEIVETVVRLRWSRPFDLVEAMTTLATEASFDAAEARDELEDVEDELFRFGRIVAGDRDLARILGDRTAPAAGKGALLDRLLHHAVVIQI